MSQQTIETTKQPLRHLILGGVKSGKSRFAEQAAGALSEHVALIATAQPLDQEMAQRIERHQQDRPKSWHTLEEPLALGQALRAAAETASAEAVIVDCLTLWLTNLLMQEDEALLAREKEDFLQTLEGFTKPLFLVSNETNMGVMPMGDLSRRFCDVAGSLHKELAQRCERVDLIVAGLPLSLKPGR